MSSLLPRHFMLLFFPLMRTCHASLIPGETELGKDAMMIRWHGENKKKDERSSRFIRGE